MVCSGERVGGYHWLDLGMILALEIVKNCENASSKSSGGAKIGEEFFRDFCHAKRWPALWFEPTSPKIHVGVSPFNQFLI